MKLINYIRLLKFRYHISFVFVILGAIISTHGSLSKIVVPLLITYVSFNLLMYGGLYTLNDIADVKSDREHPNKKNRPLASGNVSILSAYIFSFVFIIFGLSISFFYFGTNIFVLYLFFIIVNQIYTRLAKKIPYVEILFNSLTYPMRFLLGALVVGEMVSYYSLSVVFMFAFGLMCLRRIIERKSSGWEARKVLKYYTNKKLIILQIMALVLIIMASIIDYSSYSNWYIFATVLYLIFMFGVHSDRYSNNLNSFYKWLFLN